MRNQRLSLWLLIWGTIPTSLIAVDVFFQARTYSWAPQPAEVSTIGISGRQHSPLMEAAFIDSHGDRRTSRSVTAGVGPMFLTGASARRFADRLERESRVWISPTDPSSAVIYRGITPSGMALAIVFTGMWTALLARTLLRRLMSGTLNPQHSLKCRLMLSTAKASEWSMLSGIPLLFGSSAFNFTNGEFGLAALIAAAGIVGGVRAWLATQQQPLPNRIRAT